MSADDFERLSAEINPAGTAFSARLTAATQELSRLQAIEQELREDARCFDAHMNTVRHRLESTVRSLSAAHAKRARLIKELAQCDGDINKYEKEKVVLTQEVSALSTSRTNSREARLQSLLPPGSAAAASVSEERNLLGDAQDAHAPVDLLDGISISSATEDLLGIVNSNGKAGPGDSGSALDALLNSSAMPPSDQCVGRPAGASAPFGSGGSCSSACFAGFDVEPIGRGSSSSSCCCSARSPTSRAPPMAAQWSGSTVGVPMVGRAASTGSSNGMGASGGAPALARGGSSSMMSASALGAAQRPREQSQPHDPFASLLR